MEKIDSNKLILQDIAILKNNDKLLEVQHKLKLKRHDICYQNYLFQFLMKWLK